MTITLAILAAGLGTRFGGGGAKQLEPLGPSGETLIDYSVHDALRVGFERVVLIIRPEQEREFTDSVIARWSRRTAIRLVFQASRDTSGGKAWGTAHATLCLSAAVDGPFAILNGDDFYGRESIAIVANVCSAAIKASRTKADAVVIPAKPETIVIPAKAGNPGTNEESTPAFTTDYAVVGFPLVSTLRTANTVSRAILQSDKNGWLTNIDEARVTPASDGIIAHTVGAANSHAVAADALVSMNMWGFTPAVFPQLEHAFKEFRQQHRSDPEAEFLLPQFVRTLLTTGKARVRLLRGTGAPTGLTHPGDRDSVRDFLGSRSIDGEYPSPLWGT